MNAARFGLFLLCSCLMRTALWAQDPERTGNAESISTASDEIDARVGIEEFDEDEFEERDDLLRRPPDINAASREYLRRIPGISDPLVDRLLAWRGAGRILSFDELRRIPGMSSDILRSIRRYTTLGGPALPSTVIDARMRNTLTRPDLDEALLDAARGERSDNRIMLHLKGAEETLGSGTEIAAGLRLRKDPGSVRYGDVRSEYVQLALRQEAIFVTAGTFRVSHGEGVMMKSGGMLSERVEDRVRTMNDGTRLSPFVGATTSASLLGLAAEKRWNRWTALLLTSDRPVALSPEPSSASHVGTGARERTVGGTVEWKPSAGLRLTSALLHSDLRASGGSARASNLSLGGSYEFADGVFSGEIAVDEGRRPAWSSLLKLMPLSDVTIGAAVDRRPTGFHAPLSASTASWKRVALGEDRFDAFARIDLADHVRLLASVQSGRVLTRSSASVTGLFRREWNVAVTFAPTTRAAASIQFRHVASEVLRSPDAPAFTAGATSIGLRTQRTLRLSFATRGSDIVLIRTRLERSFASAGTEEGEGVMIAQEVHLADPGRFSFLARIALFDVDAYDARIFGVEPDLPGSGAISVFDGRGFRWTLVGRASVFDGLELSAKYMHTVSVPRPSGQSQRRRPEVRTWSGGIQLEHRIEIP